MGRKFVMRMEEALENKFWLCDGRATEDKNMVCVERKQALFFILIMHMLVFININVTGNYFPLSTSG